MSLQAQSTNLHAQLNTNANDPSLLDWPLGLCDCCSYKDPMTGSCQWFPYFIPMSVFGTCCIVGRIQSLLMHEKPLCCEMGCGGWSCCCLSMPINFLAPLGTSCVRCLAFWCLCFLRQHHMCSRSSAHPPLQTLLYPVQAEHVTTTAWPLYIWPMWRGNITCVAIPPTDVAAAAAINAAMQPVNCSTMHSVTPAYSSKYI